jgi:hypothetical protein
MKTVTCWEILVWDGADHMNPGFYVLSETEAQLWKKEHKHDSYQRRDFVFFDTVAEYQENSLAETRKRLLTSLTPWEKRALGVDNG